MTKRQLCFTPLDSMSAVMHYNYSDDKHTHQRFPSLAFYCGGRGHQYAAMNKVKAVDDGQSLSGQIKVSLAAG